MMNKKEKQQFTAKIADISPIRFDIKPEEEDIYRKACFSLNEIWKKFRAQEPGGDSHTALAKVALAFAELYHRKDAQLKEHAMLMDSFEKDLDDILYDKK
jgi:hypothetical protein